jgi:hypothetical protein
VESRIDVAIVKTVRKCANAFARKQRSILLKRRRGVLSGKPISCVSIPSVRAPEGDYLLLPAVNDPLCGPTVLLLISDTQFASGGPPGSTMALDPAA